MSNGESLPPFLGEGTLTGKGKDEGFSVAARKAGKHPRTRNENQLDFLIPLLFFSPRLFFFFTHFAYLPCLLVFSSLSLSLFFFLFFSFLVISPSPRTFTPLNDSTPFVRLCISFFFFVLFSTFFSAQTKQVQNYHNPPK